MRIMFDSIHNKISDLLFIDVVQITSTTSRQRLSQWVRSNSMACWCFLRMKMGTVLKDFILAWLARRSSFFCVFAIIANYFHPSSPMRYFPWSRWWRLHVQILQWWMKVVMGSPCFPIVHKHSNILSCNKDQGVLRAFVSIKRFKIPDIILDPLTISRTSS